MKRSLRLASRTPVALAAVMRQGGGPCASTPSPTPPTSNGSPSRSASRAWPSTRGGATRRTTAPARAPSPARGSAASGQGLGPVGEPDDGRVLVDSMAIVAWIDETWPQPAPLYPIDPARRREVEAFVEFFNHVWKVPPNAIDAERRSAAPDTARIAAWGAQLRGWQHGFDA